MKLIVRADDLGFSEAVNYGIQKTVQSGIVRNVGLMPNMEAAEHGFSLIKEADIALGQHTNICVGKPVSDPALIPSLVDDYGEFYTSSIIKNREKDSIVLAEAIIEIEAQLEKFQSITGRKPDYFEGHAIRSNTFFTALNIVAKKHHLFLCDPMDPVWRKKTKIVCGDMYQLDEHGLYDPYRYLFENQANIDADKTTILVYHPGYLDQYLLDHSSFTLIRPLECAFLCSNECKQWIQEQNVKLCDFRNYQEVIWYD